MAIYQHILVGIDLTDDCKNILNKANDMATKLGAKLTVAHIVEPIAFAYGGDVPIDVSEVQFTMEDQAKKRLNTLVKECELITSGELIKVGQTATELHDLSKQIGADLIVVGSHGRHGLALLLGSTANGVLHGANCDVLAIRV